MNRTELKVEEMEQVNAGWLFFLEKLDENTAEDTAQTAMMTASFLPV